MPVGRTYDIKTGKDWEGDGIAPDIAVDPKQALVVALEKAGLSHEEAVRLDAQEVPAEPVHRDKLSARDDQPFVESAIPTWRRAATMLRSFVPRIK